MRGRLSFQLPPTPGVRSSEPAANSLFWNILRVTDLDPIFCEPKTISPARNLPESNILRASIQKSRRPSSPAEPLHQTLHLHGRVSSHPASTPDLHRSDPAANSLFQNILRVTHLNPIFCGHKSISSSATYLNSIFYTHRSQKLRSCTDPLAPTCAPKMSRFSACGGRNERRATDESSTPAGGDYAAKSVPDADGPADP